jgi:hypothetical protein
MTPPKPKILNGKKEKLLIEQSPESKSIRSVKSSNEELKKLI